MALSVPNYIEAANIQDANIRFPWDDWNVEQAEEPVDEEFVERLKRISQRGIVAFTAGSAEWIVQRFAALSDDPLPEQYVETAWAMMVDLRYCGVTWDDYTVESATWTGPVRRPLSIAMVRVEYTFQAIIEYGDIELSAAWISDLAQHVMTDPAPYREWQERTIERFEELYPYNTEDKLGEVVPREALDPSFDFRVEQTQDLVNRFLSNANPGNNTFLNTPERMREQGFTGTPYAFDIQQDRNTRLGQG
jgi:hypothetical protein